MGVEAIAPTLSLIGAGTGFAQSASANRAIGAGISSAGRAAQTQIQQLSATAELEKKKALNDTRAIIGRIRAAAGGSTRALLNQAAFDGAVNRAIVSKNYEMQVAAVRSQLAAQVASLSSGYTSPILASFTNGLRGFQSGLVLEDLATTRPSMGIATYGAGGNMAGPPG